MTGSVVDGVRKWLSENGYPLEYQAARIAANVGFRVHQGVTYPDGPPGGQKARDIDVVAELETTDPNLFVGLVLECKSGEDPWLVLTHEGDERPALTGELIGWNLRPGGFAPDHAAYHVHERRGFGLVRPHAKPPRGEERSLSAYAAMSQAISAANGLASERVGPRHAAMIVPLLVVNRPLLCLGYLRDGTELLDEVGWFRILWAGHDTGERTLFDIVHVDSLEAHLRLWRRGLQAALPWFRERMLVS